MPVIPSLQKLQATTPNILNAIRNDLGGSYKDYIPLAANTNQSIQNIGQRLMEHQGHQNSFLWALVNRIGMTIIKTQLFTNPYKMFKKGILLDGETVQEIYVALAEPHQFNPSDAETTLYKRYLPNVSSAYHSMNYTKFYPYTIQDKELRLAFLSIDGVNDLINKMIASLYTAMEYDEFLVIKYLIARSCLNGFIKPTTIPTISSATLPDIAIIMKEVSNNFTYLKDKYNYAQVPNSVVKNDQYLMMDTHLEARYDVELLAVSFNMDKVEFTGHVVGIDSFSDFDEARLALLFKDDPTYSPFTTDEKTALASIHGLLMSKDFLMLLDNLLEMKSKQNEKGLYTNHFLHTWKTFSLSPFENATVFTTLTPSVTSVTITPSAVTLSPNTKMSLSVDVVTTGFADKGVIWSTDDEDGNSAIVTPDGQLSILKTATPGTIIVTATSIFDNTKTDTATITVV